MATKEKAPAFQFYPKDWDTDRLVIPMTYEEEGVYWALCRQCWLEGSLPADLDDLRSGLKGNPSRRKMDQWWQRVGKCFLVREDGRLVHKRLEQERQKQQAWKVKSSEGGRARVQVAARSAGQFTSHPPATHQPEHQPPTSRPAEPPTSRSAPASTSSSSSSSFSSSERAKTRADFGPTLSRRRNLNACFEGPIFDIPNTWAEKAIREANGRITPLDVQQFARDLTADCERDGRGVEGGTLLAWLDRQFVAWRAQRDDREAGRKDADRLKAYLDTVAAVPPVENPSEILRAAAAAERQAIAAERGRA